MLEQTKTSISTLNQFFDYERPEEYEYDIEEIALSLSHLCRYTGHVHRFYSVAEHSVLVSMIVPEKYALEGLLHDASEAFCGDVNKPLKEMLPGYKAIEERVQASISNHFGLVYPFPEPVHIADKQMYWAERKDVARSKVGDSLWNQENAATRKVLPVGWEPYKAKRAFLNRYAEIMKDRNEYHKVVQTQAA